MAVVSRFEELLKFYEDALRSLKHCLDNSCGQSPLPVAGLSQRQSRLDELDRATSMQLLASIEATLRLDANRRCEARWKDDLSKSLRVRQRRNANLRFDEDILDCWGRHHPDVKPVIGELRGALKYRHWLAHGMYWTPKLGRRYDFEGIYIIAQNVATRFPLRIR